MKPSADAAVIPIEHSRASDYIALAKPRLNFLVVVSALAGYAMAGGEATDALALAGTAVGTALVAGGASAFNQILERHRDALMRRTRLRPLPDGRLRIPEALGFAFAISLLGGAILWAGANLLSAIIALATLVIYAAIYTPSKPLTSFSTVIGAIPGALPPLIGWAAVRDSLSQGAWVLFGIVFLWQLPHFLAIAWMYREDYARAGYPMLPVIEPDGRSTARQTVGYTAALLPLSLAQTLIGMAGALYFAGALALTLLFLALSVRFAVTRAAADARRLFFGSILYLPLLWILMIADRV